MASGMAADTGGAPAGDGELGSDDELLVVGGEERNERCPYTMRPVRQRVACGAAIYACVRASVSACYFFRVSACVCPMHACMLGSNAARPPPTSHSHWLNTAATTHAAAAGVAGAAAGSAGLCVRGYRDPRCPAAQRWQDGVSATRCAAHDHRARLEALPARDPRTAQCDAACGSWKGWWRSHCCTVMTYVASVCDLALCRRVQKHIFV